MEILTQSSMALYGKMKSRKINLYPVYQMREIHPKTVFVLSPIRLENADIVGAHEALERAFAESDVHYLNLSRILTDARFRDYVHYDERGRQTLLEELRSALPQATKPGIPDDRLFVEGIHP